MQDDNDEVQWSTDTSAAAIAARAAEQLSGATADMVTQGNIEVCPTPEHTQHHPMCDVRATNYTGPLQQSLRDSVIHERLPAAASAASSAVKFASIPHCRACSVPQRDYLRCNSRPVLEDDFCSTRWPHEYDPQRTVK
jgi:hypothetical protein